MRVLILLVFTFLSIVIVADSHKKQQNAEPPNVVRAVPAIYPILAAVSDQSGDVVVEVTIAADGMVLDAKSIEGPKLFRDASERSARLWVFNKVNSKSSRVARLSFSFKLVPRKAATPEELLPVFLPPFGVQSRATPPSYAQP